MKRGLIKCATAQKKLSVSCRRRLLFPNASDCGVLCGSEREKIMWQKKMCRKKLTVTVKSVGIQQRPSVILQTEKIIKPMLFHHRSFSGIKWNYFAFGQLTAAGVQTKGCILNSAADNHDTQTQPFFSVGHPPDKVRLCYQKYVATQYSVPAKQNELNVMFFFCLFVWKSYQQHQLHHSCQRN